jgi:uridine phosphorylase
MPRQPHIHLDRGQFPAIALLPGDPKRVLRIAELLSDVRRVTENREYLGVVGTYRGVELGVISTGMGCPSAAIAVEELANIGVRTFIRVGTCGALRANIAPGDCIIPFAAVRAEGTTKEYLPPEFPAVADPDVYQALVRAAQGRGVTYHVGIDRCHDAFYEPIENLTQWGALLREPRFRGHSPLVSSEMECSAVFMVAMLRGCRVGAIMSVNTTEPLDRLATNPALAYKLLDDPRATDGVDRAIAVALDAAVALAGTAT